MSAVPIAAESVEPSTPDTPRQAPGAQSWWRAWRALRFDLLIALALFALPLAFFWQVTLGGRTLLPADNLYQFPPYAAYRAEMGVPSVAHNMLVSDLVLENLPWKLFARESLTAGEIPLWNPYLFAGAPFLAAGQHSALYPFSLIYLVLPLDLAYGWFTVSQLWLAGLFMYLFMRGLGVRRTASLYAAIVFQMSGFFLASVVFQMIIAAAAWLPFLLLMLEFVIRRRPLFGKPAVVPWVVFGALGLGMTVLAGHVEFVYYALLVMAFWAACRLLHALFTRAEAFRRLLQSGVALLAMVALGLAVGAVQFVPLVELAGSSAREGRASFDEVRSYAFPARQVLAYVMPNLFGNPAQHTYFDVFAGETRPVDWTIGGPDAGYQAHVTDTMMPGGKNYVEGACYVGILTLALATLGAVGIFDRRLKAGALLSAPATRRAPGDTSGPYRATLVALALVSVSFVFGTLTYAVLYYGLPGFSQLHSPFRWVFPLTLCLAALAGFGLDALAQAERRSADAAEAGLTQRAARLLALLLLGVGTLTLLALLVSRLFFGQMRGLVERLYTGLAGATLTYPSVEIFYNVKFRDVLIFGLLALAAGGLLWLLSRWAATRARAWGWQLAALALVAFDLALASAGFNASADPRWLDFTPPSVMWLQARDPSSWRLTTIQGAAATLNANSPWRHGLQDIRGYDSIIARQYVEYMTRVQPQSQLLYNRIAPVFLDTLPALDSPWLDLLAVRYVVTDTATPLDLGAFSTYREAYRDEAAIIYENTEAWPRAALLDAASCAALSEETPPDSALRLQAAAEIRESRFNQVTVYADVAGSESRCLLLADSYAPGWRAYQRPVAADEDQEQELPITRLFGNFRGVDLPPGESVVRFRYSPPSFQVWAFASFLALVLLLFVGMVWAWRRLYPDEAGTVMEGSGARRFAKNSLAPIALNLFNRLVDLAFAFIMLRLLGPASAGTYYYAIVIFGWFDILTNFGLNTLLTREVARDRASARRLLFHSSLLRLGLAGAGVPLLFGFLLLRSGLQPPLDPTAVLAILLLYIGLVPNSISTGLTALFYAFEKAETPAAVSTVTAILKAAFGLAALLAGYGVIGLAGVSILLNVITLGILLASARALSLPQAEAARGTSTASLDGALIRSMLATGWPLMLNHLLATLFFKIDVVILEVMQGQEVVGTYSTAYKWLDALGVVPSLFTMALLPIMARLAIENRGLMARTYQLATKIMFGLALPAAIATTFLATFLITLLGGPRFLPDGAIALQLMVWFIPIGWLNSLTNYVLIALDQQNAMRWAFLAGVSFNVLSNLAFIPLYGYRAAAIITILSEAVLLVAFYRLLRREMGPVRWLAALWRFAAAGLMMAGIMALLWPIGPFLALAAGGLAYPAALVALRPLDAWEMGRLAPLLPRRLRQRLPLAEA